LSFFLLQPQNQIYSATSFCFPTHICFQCNPPVPGLFSADSKALCFHSCGTPALLSPRSSALCPSSCPSFCHLASQAYLAILLCRGQYSLDTWCLGKQG
ncbi:unnamed protein product, partial [Coccothraustes coccothraustes]